ncbi:dual specificity protein phosphatase [Strigomonas culicis]|uniref:Dual specificity protein phosphatase n=1 Tax=Strigomonas culicis TaxID=28005 RepID=S9U1G1_9TRYP|nr:dual specificity protein phosphatase [Strigomonas culicis]|eukprot:EPY24572.1 dual specificity protein phosphatase [Strigomonas culicis]
MGKPTGSPQLPDNELILFFSVLRFMSQHNASAAVAVATPAVGSVPTSATPSCEYGGSSVEGRRSSGSSLPPSSTESRASKGVSSLRNNRFAVPECIAGPLEAFRMAATNLPVDAAAVAATRERLLEALLASYGPHAAALSELFARAAAGALRQQEAVSLSGSGMQSMQEVLPGLYCGSYHPAAQREQLDGARITHILCCIGTAPRFPGDYMYLTIPADDRPEYNIRQHFDRTFDFIESATLRGGTGVLVHCGAGISRAPIIVAAYLVRKLRMPPGQAVAFVQRRRPFASPNAGFVRQLREYAESLGVVPQGGVCLCDATAAHDSRHAASVALQARHTDEGGSLLK